MVTVGAIKRAHGIQGMVEVIPFTFDETRFDHLKRVYLNDSNRTELHVSKVRYTNKGILIKFKESNDRNYAESIVKRELQVPDDERIELPEDTFFIDDLIGCEVYGKTNQLIGKVVNVTESPANDIYIVQNDEGKENLIPAISKFVKDIDTENKIIRIEEIPGLIQLIHINYVTGFPEYFESPLNTSMLKKAQKKGAFQYEIFDLKDYTLSKHKTIDDVPFAGKPGMLLKPEPFFRAMDHIEKSFKTHRVIYCGPEGKTLDQKLARELAGEETLTFLCGHFKGIDTRVLDEYVTDRISIGDYIITGGELASVVVTDAVVRLVPGVLQNVNSANTDSFEDTLLDCDYYTRPEEYRGKDVPSVLLGGHHKKIDDWKLENKLHKTQKHRPDLYKKYKEKK